MTRERCVITDRLIHFESRCKRFVMVTRYDPRRHSLRRR